jgi:hypothetical protein
MKRALILMLTLSACATPYRVPCLTPEQLQELEKAEPPKVGDSLSGRADEDIRIISGSAIRLRQWGRGNLEVLRGCTG